MDIVLEFVDTFIADSIYAHLFPIENPNKTDINSSPDQMEEPWVWRPATKYFHVQPSQAAYMSSLARDNLYRQLLTIYFIGCFIAFALYFFGGNLLYRLIFDKRRIHHPKFLKNQIWVEIKMTLRVTSIAIIFITPVLLLEVRGYSKLYDTTADGPGWWYNILQIPLFLLFTDFCTYWIHRLSHHPRIYSHFIFNHKLHHKFIITTPYTTYAAHPFEGITFAWLHHIVAFIFPFQKVVHSLLLIFTISWTICIHNGTFLNNSRVLIDAPTHSLHHIHSNCNFGQFFVFFDRLHGTYRKPEKNE